MSVSSPPAARPVRTLSHSSIQDFLTCPRKFEWRRVRRLRKKAKARALRLGDCYHYGLDLLKKGEGLESVLERIWAGYQDVPSWVRNVDAWFLDCEICVRLLCAWSHFTEPLDVVVSEVPFEAKIRNPETGWSTGRFRLRGVIDGIVRVRDGRLGVLEHKTTSQSIEAHSDFLRRLRVDSQISRYLNTARELGVEASTVIYDITRKPSIRPRRVTKKEKKALRSDGRYFDQPIEKVPDKLDRETPEMFGARLTDDICRDPARYFRRLEVPRLPQDLYEEGRELWQQQQTIARALKTGAFFRNTFACLSPYRCEFADLCLAGINPSSLAAGEVPDGYESTHRKEESET